MEDGVCADCTMLHQSAFDAIVRHAYAESQLAIAKLQHDSPMIENWELLLEDLFHTRSAAIGAYREHANKHAKAASAG
jgi:hypothetical protein